MIEPLPLPPHSPPERRPLQRPPNDPVPMKTEWTLAELNAQEHTLKYFLDIAMRHGDASIVWKALFSEVLENVQNRIRKLGEAE